MVKPTGPVKETIVVAMGQQPDTFHPLIGSSLAREEVLGLLFTHPVRSDNRGEWVAIGVEQVPTIENEGARFVGDGDDRHLEVTFKVRQGIKWQDGVPTTARDLVFAWNLVMNPDFPATSRELATKVFSMEAPDDYTAVVKYRSARQARDAAANGFRGLPKELWAPYADQREPLTTPSYFDVPVLWLPEHILGRIPAAEQQKSDWATRNPVGNGPYRMVDVSPGQSLRLEAVSTFFMGAPPTRSVVIRFMPDTNSQIAALQAGEIDLTTQVSGAPDVDRAPVLDNLPGYRASYIPGTRWEHLDMNNADPVLGDRTIRKALAHGINRQEMVDTLLFGKTRVATSWIQPGVPAWAYDESCPTRYSYDPAQARSLIEQAGYSRGSDDAYQKAGQPLQLRLHTSDVALRRSVAQVIQAQLKQVGVTLDLDFLPGSGLFATDGPLLSGTFQLGLFAWISSPDPDVSSLYKSTSIPTPENNWSGQNSVRFRNPQVDELLTRGANELSVDVRKGIYCEAVRIWTDEVPVLPLFQGLVVTVARANMANYRPTPSSTPETWNSWAWFIPVR